MCHLLVLLCFIIFGLPLVPVFHPQIAQMAAYIIGFLGASAVLLSWVYAQRRYGLNYLRTAISLLFWSFLSVYGFGLLDMPTSFSSKIGLFARDMLVLSGSTLLWMTFLRKRAWILQGAIFTGGLLLLYGGYGLWLTYTKIAIPSSLHPDAELLIQLKTGKQSSELLELQQRYQLKISPAFNPQNPEITRLDDFFVLDVPARFSSRLKQIERTLYKSGLVDWVEPNEIVALSPLPSSSTQKAQDQFSINDPALNQLWGFDAMKVNDLYQYLEKSRITPRKKALIVILDTGIDAGHEDIKDNYLSISKAYDNDPLSHGTHCAGIAASVSNNGKGIASFSTDNAYFRVSSVRVLNSGGSGTQQGIIKGMLEAADAGADVISMSLGGRSGQVRQSAYKQAVEYAAKKGAVVVAAAGNSNRNAKEFAPVNTPGVIGVSAVDAELNRAAFSNYVADIPMGLAAPGVEIYSTIPGNKYASFNGTSMATPYVAGLVGLLKSVRPELTTREIWEILHRTGRETRNTRETGRLIQPGEALKALQ